jgi:hypothetical protein
MPLRIYLTSRVLVEDSGTLLDERRLMGRQGRLAFAYLVGEHLRVMPPSWERSLSALISKLRALLGLESGMVEPLRGRNAPAK